MAFKLIKAAQARWRASAHRTSSRSSALAPASNAAKLVERPEPTSAKVRTAGLIKIPHSQALTIARVAWVRYSRATPDTYSDQGQVRRSEVREIRWSSSDVIREVEVMATTPSRSGHLPINGLSLYHEVYGELGKSKASPLLLVPGGFMATDSMKSWVSAFVGKRAVIVFDQQGHGRTPDTSRKMSYEQFGDDAAALLRALKVERADVMGYSQGGGVALQLALRHPTLVNKLVSLSATYRKDGWYPSALEGIEGLSGEGFAGTPVEKAFKEHTPDATAFDAYVEKMKVLGINDQNMSDAQVSSISAKTMVVVGDADAVKPEHALAMFKLRGGGDEEAAAAGVLRKVPAARLVILAATSHTGIVAASAVLVPMVSAFLDDVPPATPDLF